MYSVDTIYFVFQNTNKGTKEIFSILTHVDTIYSVFFILLEECKKNCGPWEIILSCFFFTQNGKEIENNNERKVLISYYSLINILSTTIYVI
jgi:hypothetical protein